MLPALISAALPTLSLYRRIETTLAVREFPSFTADLHALADWLTSCGVDTVAMESTGVYWIPLFELLETRGFTVFLVNARHVNNVHLAVEQIQHNDQVQPSSNPHSPNSTVRMAAKPFRRRQQVPSKNID